MLKRILVATDGSEGGDRAVAFANDMAGAFGCELLILTVGATVDTDTRKSDQVAHREAIEAECRAILEVARGAIAHSGALMSSAIEIGDVATQILLKAQSWAADVLVVGKRGRGRLEGLLLGSVSQKLVSFALCTTVVVP